MANEIVDINNKPLTMETLLAAVDAILERSSAKIKRDLAESSEKFQRDLAKSSEKFDEEFQKLTKAQALTNKQLGGISNYMGAETTEFFYNSFKYGNKEMFGEKFDDVFTEEKRKTIKGYEDEYDILLFNGQAVCIVEVKTKADTRDVVDMGRKKITFRENFPEHNEKRLYLAMASRKFHPLTEKACIENGIAIIKQVGDTIAIYDENLFDSFIV